jgi:hypothetical protein
MKTFDRKQYFYIDQGISFLFGDMFYNNIMRTNVDFLLLLFYMKIFSVLFKIYFRIITYMIKFLFVLLVNKKPKVNKYQ